VPVTEILQSSKPNFDLFELKNSSVQLNFKMTKESMDAEAFELWKLKEKEKAESTFKKEIAIKIEEMRKSWIASQTKIQQNWTSKETELTTSYERLEKVLNEYQSVVKQRQDLEVKLRLIRNENQFLKNRPDNDSRNSRLVQIQTIREETAKLEEEVTLKTAELRETMNNKDRFKRLYLETYQSLKRLNEKENK
jgi:hypothetical protein